MMSSSSTDNHNDPYNAYHQIHQPQPPPPISTVEVPIRRRPMSAGNSPPPQSFFPNSYGFHHRGVGVGQITPGFQAIPSSLTPMHSLVQPKSPPEDTSHLPLSSISSPNNTTQNPTPPVVHRPMISASHINNNSMSFPISSDQRTHYSNSTQSTGSGTGRNQNQNILLQMAFPTAEIAMQQQILQQQQLQFMQQQQQQQQHNLFQPVNASSSPWTLGSTDGSFALSLILQDDGHRARQQQSEDDGGMFNIRSGRADLEGEVDLMAQLNQKLRTEVPASFTGAVIAHTTGEAAAGETSDATNTLQNKCITDWNDDERVYLEELEHRQKHPPEQLGANFNQRSDGTQAKLAGRHPVESMKKELSPIETNPLLLISRNTKEEALTLIREQKSLFQEQLFRQPSSAVEACLAAACEVMNFDIAEMWLRTGMKTHQLTNSHLRPTALEDSVRKDLVDVYYGEKSNERTHRLSPALCKRAKEAADVVWVTAHNPASTEALRCSISNVRTAVAVPVCHQASNTNITILFFSIRRIAVRPSSVEFLVHMSLAAGVASVNSLADDGLMDRDSIDVNNRSSSNRYSTSRVDSNGHSLNRSLGSGGGPRQQVTELVSVTGAPLNLQWRQLTNVEYLTDGGNSWIHTAVFQKKPVVVKTLKPECQDVAVAINEIEAELSIHSRLSHPNIVQLLGAGLTSKGVRFFVLERLDGGTLTQMLGYETRIRDRRRRFWRKKLFSFIDVLRIARSIAQAMVYCHEEAIPGSIVLHRDLKPDNIGFSLDGTVKLIDFGLARVIENADIHSDEVYAMSGETGSLRYMAPEVADGLPYNYTADVYSFGIILWELNATKKPYEGLSRELFYERIVHGGERPPLSRKWPTELNSIMSECWDADITNRPKFRDIVRRIDALLLKEKGGGTFGPSTGPSHSQSFTSTVAANGDSNSANNNGTSPNTRAKKFLPRISGLIDRHSTWF